MKKKHWKCNCQKKDEIISGLEEDIKILESLWDDPEDLDFKKEIYNF